MEHSFVISSVVWVCSEANTAAQISKSLAKILVWVCAVFV